MRVNFASFLPNPHKKKKKCFHLAAQTDVLKSAPKTRISRFVWSQMYHLYREATHNLVVLWEQVRWSSQKKKKILEA